MRLAPLRLARAGAAPTSTGGGQRGLVRWFAPWPKQRVHVGLGIRAHRRSVAVRAVPATAICGSLTMEVAMHDVEWWRTFFDDDYVAAWTAAGAFEGSSEQAEQIAASLPGSSLRILDVPCGFGRIAARLQERGHIVTGIDVSSEQLRMAEERNPGPVYIRGDMRSPPPGPYDAVLNLFSSFGYFSERSEDLAALQAWFGVLRPGGILIMDLMHRDGLAYALGRGHEPMPSGAVREAGVTDWVQGRRTVTVTYGAVSKTFQIWLYTATELVEALRATGFTRIEVSGDLTGTKPFSPATRLVLRALK